MPTSREPLTATPFSLPPRTSQWIVTATVFQRAQNEIDAKGKFDASSLRVAEDGAVTGACAGSSPQDRYDVRVRVGVDAIEASCTCPAATKPGSTFVQARAPGEAPRPAQPKGSCKHSAALLLWRARTLAAPRPNDADVAAPGSSNKHHAPSPSTTTAEVASDARANAPRANEPSPRIPPASAAPIAKRRRLAPSLVESAAAMNDAAAKSAKTKAPSRSPRGKPAAAGASRAGSAPTPTRDPSDRGANRSETSDAGATPADDSVARVKIESVGVGGGMGRARGWTSTREEMGRAR